MTTNAIAFQNYQENRRHNLEMEILNRQANRIGQQQADVASQNAQTNAYNAQTNAYNATSQRISAEASRTSAASSQTQAAAAWRQASNTEYYNTGWLEETRRHNEAQEANEGIKAGASLFSSILGGMNIVAGWYGL